jgi:hypothetical protein
MLPGSINSQEQETVCHLPKCTSSTYLTVLGHLPWAGTVGYSGEPGRHTLNAHGDFAKEVVLPRDLGRASGGALEH